jgi:hypothetical protein
VISYTQAKITTAGKPAAISMITSRSAQIGTSSM